MKLPVLPDPDAPHDPGATYDDIILGAGAAGLSLLYAMRRAGLRRRVLLVDRAPVTGEDRTWCFWARGERPFPDFPFEAALTQRWDHVWLNGPLVRRRLDIRPYRYMQLRGAAFHARMEAWLAGQPDVTRVYGEVGAVRSLPGGVQVQVDGRGYRGAWAYSSLPERWPPLAGYPQLLQHFRGWEVQAARPLFDARAATFMDFRVPQGERGDMRFVYVLPESGTRALVEYTVFSGSLLPEAEYEAGLRHYLERVLGVGEYVVGRREGGVIPMTDRPVPAVSGRVVRIGTAGGMSKPSTGYTFVRIQRHSARLALALARSGAPLLPEPSPTAARHAWMDSVLLRALAQGQEGAAFFGQLFDRNPPARVLRFLDEGSGAAQDLALMLTVNIPRFVRLGLEVAARDLRHRKPTTPLPLLTDEGVAAILNPAANAAQQNKSGPVV